MRDEFGNIDHDYEPDAPHHMLGYQNHRNIGLQVLVIDTSNCDTIGTLNVSEELARPENRSRYRPLCPLRHGFSGHPLPSNHGFAVDCARDTIYVAQDPRAVAAFSIDSFEFLGAVGPSSIPDRAAAAASAVGGANLVPSGAGREFNVYQMDEAQIRAMEADAAAAGNLHIACGVGVDERFGHVLVTDCAVSRVSVFNAF